MATERELLQEAKATLAKQNALIEQLSEGALLVGSVIAKTDLNKLVVSTGGESIIGGAALFSGALLKLLLFREDELESLRDLIAEAKQELDSRKH